MDELRTLIVKALQDSSPLTKKQLIMRVRPTTCKCITSLELTLKGLKASGVIDSCPDPTSSRFRLIWFLKNDA